MLSGILISLVHALGTVTLVAYVYGATQRSSLPIAGKSIATGLILGLGALFAMMAPTTIADGVITDGRTVFMGVAAAFGGVLSAIIAVAIASAYRFSIGGAGASAGVAGIVLAALIGLTWRFATKTENRGKLPNLLLLGAAIPLSFVAIWMLPSDVAYLFSTAVLPAMVPYSIFSTLIFGTLLNRERKLVFAEQTLREAADSDFLTGLLNRRAFTNHIKNSSFSSKADDSISTLVVLDLDHFKKINDKFGHSAGDKALVQFGKLLTQICRDSDSVARIGGEEFAVFMSNTNANQSKIALQRILDATRQQSIIVAGETVSFTTSVGAVEFCSADVTFEDALMAADKALYRAKEQGRNRFVFDSITKKAA